MASASNPEKISSAIQRIHAVLAEEEVLICEIDYVFGKVKDAVSEQPISQH